MGKSEKRCGKMVKVEERDKLEKAGKGEVKRLRLRSRIGIEIDDQD
jgi:hypothetical protein